MLYQISNGAVELGAELILKKVNFEIRNTEKIAVVGRNGCGKTTLLKLIAGEVDLLKRDSDEDIFIAKAGNPEIGYLKQLAFDDPDMTVDDEIRKVFRPIIAMQERLDFLLERMERPDADQDMEMHERDIREYTRLREEFEDIGGYYYEKEYDIMLRKFGFSLEDKSRKLSEFSGGQQTKIAFIKLLLSKPDILLLDEPTNHLDISTIEWLEDYLKNYKKAVVVVSHDRMFLDKVVDVVYEIEYQVTKRYPGNYTKFMETKRANFEKQKKDYEMQQKEIARLEMIVEKYKNTPSKVAMTRSKLKAIEHMEKIEAPDRFDTGTFHANFKPKRETGKEVLRVSNLEIGYDHVISLVNMVQTRGQKIGIIGGNGVGKSTFLKTLTGLIPALGGEYSFGYQVDTGYFDQQMAQYNSKKTVLDDFWDEYPTLDRTEIRSALGAFMFTQDEVFKTVDMLSGGEKVRLALCKIFKTKPNFLLLDEPTNHMDIVGKETLESMLREFPGSVLFVSHDRYFIQKLADALLIFEEDKVIFFPYGYDDYMEKVEAERARQRALEEQALQMSKNGKTAGNQIAGSDAASGRGYGISGAGAVGRGFGLAGTGGSGQNQNNTGSAAGQDTADTMPVVPKGKASYEQGKERSRLEKKMKKLEEQISKLEAAIEEKKAELLKPEYASSYSKLGEISAEIETMELELFEVMEEWDSTGEQLEALGE